MCILVAGDNLAGQSFTSGQVSFPGLLSPYSVGGSNMDMQGLVFARVWLELVYLNSGAITLKLELAKWKLARADIQGSAGNCSYTFHG